MNLNKIKLKEIAKNFGSIFFGVADISAIKKDFLISQNVLADLNRGIVLGARLSDPVLDDITDYPTKHYFHHYKTANMFLDQMAFKLSGIIQSGGYKAMPVAASQLIDWEKQKAHLSHKHIGVLAGLGWIGRNNLLVNKEFGSRFRLVTILTDMDLESDKPLKFDCGSCRACIETCPAKAIKENTHDFDHIACYEKLREFQKKGLVGQYICGVCVKACKPK